MLPPELGYHILYHDGDIRQEKVIHAEAVGVTDSMVLFLLRGAIVAMFNTGCVISVEVLDVEKEWANR
jgi:hypothetical protein